MMWVLEKDMSKIINRIIDLFLGLILVMFTVIRWAVIIMVVSFLSYYGWVFTVPSLCTYYEVRAAAYHAYDNDINSGVMHDYTDYWGNPIELTRTKDMVKVYFKYLAVSAGEDGQMGTSDDISFPKVYIPKDSGFDIEAAAAAHFGE